MSKGNILPKLSSACSAMRAVKLFVYPQMLKAILLTFPLYNLIRHNFLGSHTAQYKSF